ncbi:O-antigen ligase family protein [Pelagicoccus sp. SDUM812005]|uniref:O-antigen ligase family protein n=1 Tax=Pelagicoccus sp. SDUM812005 TaxID=3041257 RepID=UPI00280C62F2|nr:O-antigen ligase family protein [Pelagicoccus sp. SDUM812005]MDQ8180643.1 O-antigen ligase family protein [Pelagicoccus sp. SDUM812005]
MALRSPAIALAMGLSIPIAIATLRWPFFGFAFLTFLLPLERIQRFTDDTSEFTISIMRFVALGTLAVLMLYRITRKERIIWDKSWILYGGYVIIASFGLFVSSDVGGTKRALGTIGANCIFLFMYLNFFRTRKQIYAILGIWIGASLLAVLYSTYDWHLGSGRDEGIQTEVDPGKGAQTTENRWSTVWQDRAEWETLGGHALRRSMGPTSHAAVYGINMIMTLPFLIYLLQRSQRQIWRMTALASALGLTLYNVMLTNTRAVMLQAALTCALCIGLGLFKIRTFHLLIGIVVAGIGLLLMPPDVYNRILDIENYDLENSAAMRVRIEYWKAGMRIINDNWLVGMGVGNEYEIPKYVKGGLTAEKSTVHNTFLQFFLEVGVFGWLLFYSFVGTLLYYANKAARTFKPRPDWQLEYKILVAIQVAMVSVLTFGLQVDVFLFPLKGWWLLATIATVLYRWSQALPTLDESVETRKV